MRRRTCGGDRPRGGATLRHLSPWPRYRGSPRLLAPSPRRRPPEVSSRPCRGLSRAPSHRAGQRLLLGTPARPGRWGRFGHPKREPAWSTRDRRHLPPAMVTSNRAAAGPGRPLTEPSAWLWPGNPRATPGAGFGRHPACEIRARARVPIKVSGARRRGWQHRHAISARGGGQGPFLRGRTLRPVTVTPVAATP